MMSNNMLEAMTEQQRKAQRNLEKWLSICRQDYIKKKRWEKRKRNKQIPEYVRRRQTKAKGT